MMKHSENHLLFNPISRNLLIIFTVTLLAAMGLGTAVMFLIGKF